MLTSISTQTCATPAPMVMHGKEEMEQKETVAASLLGCPITATTEVTAAEALEVSKAARHHLARLLLSAKLWTNVQWSDSPASSTSGSCPHMVSASQQKPPSQNGNMQIFQTPADAADTLHKIQTTLEDTQYLLVTCLNEVYGALSRYGSAHASAAASCGISHTSSPYDAHRSTRDALCVSNTNVPMEMASGSAALVAQNIPVVSGFTSTLNPISYANSEANKTPVQDAPAQFVQRFVTKRPTRMRWPAAQFCYVVHVEFKRGRVRRFFSRVSVKPANYALVPGDRGYDCGLVIQCALWNPHKHAFDVDTVQSLDAEIWPAGNHGTIMEVIRLATDDEVHRLHNEHVSMERLALNTCRNVADRLSLPMQVLDCEYQYDGTKISFFFDSAEMIDFRQLNKELYRIFNVRIWMQNTNGAVRNAAPPNAASAHW